ncbi:hypothetical protein CNECB9_3250010 [Cupriavidus necator]|uniref:Uncharacterized protein n=1 Tax=Cupriavidus necator TaxID=106590 RepID=A0A1K0IHC7_CUPNE|nr:hypothetical protein CNECB9_3250010 [Cupriavidus necator]
MFYRVEGPGVWGGGRLSQWAPAVREFSDYSRSPDVARMSHFHAASRLPVSLTPAL